MLPRGVGREDGAREGYKGHHASEEGRYDCEIAQHTKRNCYCCSCICASTNHNDATPDCCYCATSCSTSATTSTCRTSYFETNSTTTAQVR